MGGLLLVSGFDLALAAILKRALALDLGLLRLLLVSRLGLCGVLLVGRFGLALADLCLLGGVDIRAGWLGCIRAQRTVGRSLCGCR